MREIIAHKEQTNQKEYIQLLSEHLVNVATYCGEIGGEIGLKHTCYLIGLLHDIGKADKKWQDYIWNEKKELVNHTSAGGLIIAELLRDCCEKNNILKINSMIEVFETVIFSHHGVYDVIDNNYVYVNDRRKKYDDGTYDINGVKKYFEVLKESLDLDIEHILEEVTTEFKIVEKKLVNMAKVQKGKEKESISYYYHILFRLLLSILKEADIYDSSNSFKRNKNKIYEKDETNKLWGKYVKRIEKISMEFENIENKSELNKARCEISEQCKNSGLNNSAGIYKADLPTGAGKTISTFRYALNNAKINEKDRIFYITAYLSVLEQNANEIKNIIEEDEHVLEHHSNVINEEELDKNFEENEDEIKQLRDKQYLLDGWETPIILTTMVQFFNTLFKARASNIRRFSKLINSIIIMDEVQSIPKKLIYNHNLFMNFLKEIMNVNIIHCTATEPHFDSEELEYKVNYGGTNGEDGCIAKIKESTKVFDRVELINLSGESGKTKINTEELANRIISDNKENSVLVILNTKAAVKRIYDKLNEKDIETYYLTTNMCARHRLDKIEELKERLKNNEKIICISTQLIEAGVDVDFDVVYRSLAGVDSIVQSMGRCNREGKKPKGVFYLINYEEEIVEANGPLKDIYIEKYTTSSLLTDIQQIDNTKKLKETYYKKYYGDNKSELKYLLKDKTSIMELLSFNETGRDAYKKQNSRELKHIIAQSFKTAAKNIKYIDNEAKGVIVYYKESEKLIRELFEAFDNYDFAEIKRILKKLQAYTITEYNIESVKDYVLTEKRFSEVFKNNIYILRKEYYNKNIGKCTENNLESYIF